MRCITADLILTGDGEFTENLVICVNKKGIIASINNCKKNISQDIEKYSGTIIPAFINVHCHLELSHLKNAIPRKLGLINFIQNVSQLRNNIIQISDMEVAEREMLDNGIIAVGDISNSSLSFKLKKSKNIKYFTFVEVLGLRPENCGKQIKKGEELYNLIKFSEHKSIVPHAPYNVHPDLFLMINKSIEINHNAVISIHNQEDINENLMFTNRSGDFVSFFKSNGISTDFIHEGYISSLDYTLENLNIDKKVNLLLVHNTYTDKNDIEKAKSSKHSIYWVLCPNSNLFIGNKLPDINLFYDENVQVAIGTDSYASNSELSILSELKTINSYFPKIPINVLFNWATLGGAKALNFDKEFGSIEIGKKCGLNILKGVNFDKNCIKNASIQRLI